MWKISLGILFASVTFLLYLARKKSTAVSEYDERQMANRGKAYRFGFLTTIVLAVFASLALMMEESLQQYGAFLLMAAAFTGITVFAVITIWTDAFHSTMEKPAAYLLLIGVIVISNAVALFTAPEIHDVQAVLTSVRGINLICMITFLIVEITFACKMIMEKREDEDE